MLFLSLSSKTADIPQKWWCDSVRWRKYLESAGSNVPLMHANCILLYSSWCALTGTRTSGKCTARSAEWKSVSRPVRQQSQEVQRVQSQVRLSSSFSSVCSAKRLRKSLFVPQTNFFSLLPFFSSSVPPRRVRDNSFVNAKALNELIHSSNKSH